MPGAPAPVDPAAAHVVVVGAGGIGCPAAWGLVEAGVGRLTVLDGDEVALSNLPRQILYRPADVGRPKAQVLAERLAGASTRVTGLPVRLDDRNADDVLATADLVVDATDGARVKDWLNALAVGRRLPFVHAAGLRSEARLLDVPAGGRPCLACLFGRLEEELGTCADLGVWGGVVGTIGFLGAATAIWRLAHPQAASRGYAVLDLETGRAVTLAAGAASGCPVCANGAVPGPEIYPEPAACARPSGELDAPVAAETLDLRDEECPMNLLRARQAVDVLEPGGVLGIRLGAEGRESVPEGLRALGHDVRTVAQDEREVRLLVRAEERGAAGAGESRVGRASVAMARDDLLRFARQVVLPEVGEAGQERLFQAEATVRGRGAVAETAALYLAAAGVGTVRVEESCWVTRLRAHARGRVLAPEGDQHRGGRFRAARVPGGGRIVTMADVSTASYDGTGPVARALGAMLADTIARTLVRGSGDAPSIVVREDGTIASVERTSET